MGGKSVRTDTRNHAPEGDERIRTAVCAPSDVVVYERRIALLRADIVRALNLTPIVPPNADEETYRAVDNAWLALSELCRLLERRDA